MIRATIFDYGSVLMRTVTPLPHRELEQRYGLPPGGVDKLMSEGPLLDEVQLGRISSAEFWANVGQRLGLNAEELAEFWQAFWAGDRLDEELVSFIRYLRDVGYRTGLLSNAPVGLHERVQQLGIADAFDVIVISGCEGLMKPDLAIFELTLARMGVAAEEAIFVDDSLCNVDSARELGIHTVQFVEPAMSVAELEALRGIRSGNNIKSQFLRRFVHLDFGLFSIQRTRSPR